MTQIPVTWKEDYEVIKVHCQPYVEREQEPVLVASTDRYEALQQPSGVFWVRINVPHTGSAPIEQHSSRN